MQELVDRKLAHAVAVVKPVAKQHRVIIMPYGSFIRAFDYRLVVTPDGGGVEVWQLARSYGLGYIENADKLAQMMGSVDTAATAQRLANFTEEEGVAQVGGYNLLLFGITSLPGGASADAIDRGDYVDAVISFGGDVALLGLNRARKVAKAALALKSVEGARKFAKAQRAVVSFQAVQGVIGVTRLAQGGYAAVEGENGKAAAYFGEALLRIFGVRYGFKAIRSPNMTKAGLRDMFNEGLKIMSTAEKGGATQKQLASLWEDVASQIHGHHNYWKAVRSKGGTLGEIMYHGGDNRQNVLVIKKNGEVWFNGNTPRVPVKRVSGSGIPNEVFEVDYGQLDKLKDTVK